MKQVPLPIDIVHKAGNLAIWESNVSESKQPRCDNRETCSDETCIAVFPCQHPDEV